MTNYVTLFPRLNIFLLTIVLLSCGNEGVKNTTPGEDGRTGTRATESPTSVRDSIQIDLTKSSVACSRSKSVKAFDKKMKLFGADVAVKMDDASFTAETNLDIKNANWFILDRKFECGSVILDMKSVSALKIGEDDNVEIGNPDYLETKKYPISTLTILGFESHPTDPKMSIANASVQIKDTTGSISFPVTLDYSSGGQAQAPDKLTGEFTIDGIKWGLNPKDAKVIKDDLTFKIVLIKE